MIYFAVAVPLAFVVALLVAIYRHSGNSFDLDVDEESKVKCHGCDRSYSAIDLPVEVDPAIAVCFECWLDGLRSEPEIEAPDDADDSEPTEAEYEWANADYGGEG